MIYKFRVVLDTLEEVFRDIEIEADATLEDLHNSIIQAFGFDGTEGASFYVSDEEWNQGEEIVLFDMSEGHNSVRMMNETSMDSFLDEKQRNLIYVYDFLSMWTFYVELADITKAEDGRDYPNLMFAQGQLPDSPPEKNFEAEDLTDGLDDYDEDEGLGFENLDDFDFDQNWN